MARRPTLWLGTVWSWTKRTGVLGVIYTVELQDRHPSGILAFRIERLPSYRGRGWTTSKLPALGPWETYIDGPFRTAIDAARAVVDAFEKESQARSARGLAQQLGGGKRRKASPSRLPPVGTREEFDGPAGWKIVSVIQVGKRGPERNWYVRRYSDAWTSKAYKTRALALNVTKRPPQHDCLCAARGPGREKECGAGRTGGCNCSCHWAAGGKRRKAPVSPAAGRKRAGKAKRRPAPESATAARLRAKAERIKRLGRGV